MLRPWRIAAHLLSVPELRPILWKSLFEFIRVKIWNWKSKLSNVGLNIFSVLLTWDALKTRSKLLNVIDNRSAGWSFSCGSLGGRTEVRKEMSRWSFWMRLRSEQRLSLCLFHCCVNVNADSWLVFPAALQPRLCFHTSLRKNVPHSHLIFRIKGFQRLWAGVCFMFWTFHTC